MSSEANRGLLEVFLDEARALLRRLSQESDPSAASELVELAGVIGDAALIELVRELRTAVQQGNDASLIVDLVAQKLIDLAAPPPPPSSWDPADLAEMRSHFLTEARIHLTAIEESLLELRADPTARAPYDALFRKLHTLKGSAGSVDLHTLSATAHRLEDLLSAARNRRNAALVTAVSASLPELRRLIGVEPRADHPDAPATGFRDRRAAPPAAALRMDELLDTTSELVLDRTRIERRLRSIDEVSHSASPELRTQLAELAADVETLARTSRRLGERVRRLRAIEMSSLADRLEVVARSVARREHKQVRVLVRGGSEEVDQRLADALTEPLLHLVRNAVTHGIESPQRRIELGKNPLATITVALRQTGDGLELSIADDGAGVDVRAVREALVHAERLTTEQAEALPIDAVLATLFQPGISTRTHADDLAGRGVGLDVVADAIARLGGDVSVESTLGAGSVFSIRVPVESRVMEALLFKVSDQLFAVPSARVEEITDVHKDEIQRDTRDRVRISGELLPLLRLGALLALPPPPGMGDRRTAIVLHARDRRFAITCDRVVGPREIVVRRLPPSLTGLSPWAGATISGAGSVEYLGNPQVTQRISGAGSVRKRDAAAVGVRIAHAV